MGIIDFCHEIKNEEFKASKEAATKILEILNNCDNLEECVDKKSYLGLHVSIQPTDEFKNLVDLKHKKLKELER